MDLQTEQMKPEQGRETEGGAEKTRIQQLASELKRDRNESHFQKKIRRWMYWGLVLVLLLAAFIIWQSYQPTPVNTTIVSYQRIGSTAQPVLRSSGYVTYPRIATISANVLTPVTKLGFDVGDQVKKGAFLAGFDDQTLLAQKRVQEIAINNQQETLARTQNLYKVGAASEADLQNAKNQLESAQANLNLLNSQIDNSIVRAPFDGLIISKMIEVGEVASQGICQLADDSYILVEVDVNQEDISKISNAQSAVVTLDAYPETEYAAGIYEVMPTADPQKNTIGVKVRILKPDARFKPNMSAKVFFTNEKVAENATVKAILTVDKSALFEREGSPYLLIIQRGRVRERKVLTGTPVGDQLVEIKSGVNPDQRVVLNPEQYKLKPGELVRII